MHGNRSKLAQLRRAWSWNRRLGGGWTKEGQKGLRRLRPECWVSTCASMNPLWKVYKSKVLKTLNPEYEEDTAEEVQDAKLNPSLSCRFKSPQRWSGCSHWSQKVSRFCLLVISYSSQGQMSSLSFAFCANRTLRQKLGLNTSSCVFWQRGACKLKCEKTQQCLVNLFVMYSHIHNETAWAVNMEAALQCVFSVFTGVETNQALAHFSILCYFKLVLHRVSKVNIKLKRQPKYQILAQYLFSV